MNTKIGIPPIRTAGTIRTACARPKAAAYFYGAKLITLPVNRETGYGFETKMIRQITNNLSFHNQVIVRISLHNSARAGENATLLRGYKPDVAGFARDLIDNALRRELDSELAIMARGENIAANQRRRSMMGKYLLSKPYNIIENFYGAQMQKLAAIPHAEVRRANDVFYSDIIHERTDKTVYAPVQTQTERITVPSGAHPAGISDSDLNRIALQAARKVERKMRTQRERNGKW